MKLHQMFAVVGTAVAMVSSLQGQDALNQFEIGAETGTTGLGGYAGWRFADHFGLRAGIDYLDFSEDRTIKGVSYEADLHLSTQPVLLDYFPWVDRSFRVSLGVAFNQNELTGTASPALGTTFTIGSTTYVAAAGDRVDVEISQQPVSAYLSVGGNFFYFDDAHHWALGGEIGVLFTGDADVNLSTTSALVTAADLASERRQLQDYADDLQFWPVLKLGVSARF